MRWPSGLMQLNLHAAIRAAVRRGDDVAGELLAGQRIEDRLDAAVGDARLREVARALELRRQVRAGRRSSAAGRR